MGDFVSDTFSALGDVLDVVTGQTAKDIAEAQKEVSKVNSASQQVTAREQSRQQIRQDRVRRAQLAQTAESSGATGSSGVSGTAAALSTNLSANQAYQSGQADTANTVTGLNQDIADLNLKSQLVNQFIDYASTAATAGAA
jgi:hypothetical protein